MTGRDWDDVTREVDALLALVLRMRRIVAMQDAADMRDAVDQCATWSYEVNDLLARVPAGEHDECPV